MEERILNTDVLVIGGAGAGLRAVIEARSNGVDVMLASKMPAGGVSCTQVIAGWITGATPENEDQLFKQMVYTGGYINNQCLTETFVKEAIHIIPGLRDFGVPLEWQQGETPDLPGFYVSPKIGNNPKGHTLLQPMRKKAESMGVKIIDNVVISRLITSDGTVVGAVGVDLELEQLLIISAKSIVIATGGGAHAFERNDNPPGSTGDGCSLAYGAGAELVDMEFISLNVPKNLIPEIFEVKGEPPDSIISHGTAHYFLGGIKIDESGKTNVKGLFAGGEVAGGILGAARLGGSAVADAIVFGAIAGKSAGQWAKSTDMPALNMEQVQEERKKFKLITEENKVPAKEALAKLKSILWRYIGPVKSDYTLNKALEMLSDIKPLNIRANNSEDLLASVEAIHILELGKIIATASLVRQETRGNFWRADYPQPDNSKWIKNVVLWKDNENVATRIDNAVMTKLKSPVDPPIGSGCFWYSPRIEIY
jgi:succinate dehydrogenase/fumarate reductase flavoprotein subunit